MHIFTIRLFSLLFLLLTAVSVSVMGQGMEPEFRIPKTRLLSERSNEQELEAFRRFIFSDSSLVLSSTVQKSDPNLWYAETSKRRFTIDALDAHHSVYDSTWYAETLELERMHRVPVTDTSVVIAIVDTGVFFEHETLHNAYLLNKGELANGLDSDKNGFVDDVLGYDFVNNTGIFLLSHDDNGHGTAMASLAAGRPRIANAMVGIAPNAKILSVKAFDRFGTATSLEIARGIVYAALRGADIINLSFGDSFKSELVESAVLYAYKKGALLIGSAGNVGGNTLRYPSGFKEVQAVSWLNTNLRIASTANYGSHIQFAAPGTGVKHASIRSITGFDISSGSSASAALVSGLAAWLVSVKTSLTQQEILTLLKNNTLDLEIVGYDTFTGYGLPLPIKAIELTKETIRTELALYSFSADSITFSITVLGSSIKSWQLTRSVGSDFLPNYESLTPETSTLIADKITIPFSVSSFSGRKVTFTLVTQLWDGKEHHISDEVVFPDDGIQQQIRYSGWGFKGEQLQHSWVIETSEPVRNTLTLKNERNSFVSRSIYDRTGWLHQHTITYPDTGSYTIELNAEISGLIQTEEKETIVSSAPKVKKVQTKSKKEESLLSEMWTLPVQFGDSTAFWYVYQYQFFDGTFSSTITDRTYKGRDSTFSIMIPFRFIPKSIWKSNDNTLFFMVGYGGGNAYLFDVNRGFARIQTDFLANFTYAGLLSDTDSDQLPEIWTHNRSNVAVFEWNGTTFEKKAEFPNGSSFESDVFPNEFQVPNFVESTNSLGFLDVTYGDYDGDLFQIHTQGNDLWNLKQIYTGHFFGAGNVLKSMQTSTGTTVLLSIRHTFPGLDANRSKQPEIAILEFYDWQQDSWKFSSSLQFSDVDFLTFDIESESVDTVFVTASPSVYRIQLIQGDTKQLRVEPILTKEDLQFTGIQQGQVFNKTYLDNELEIIRLSGEETIIFERTPRLFSLDLPNWKHYALLTFVPNTSTNWNVFKQDSLVGNISTIAGLPVLYRMPYLDSETAKVELKTTGGISVFVTSERPEATTPAKVLASGENSFTIVLTEKPHDSNTIPANELAVDWLTALPLRDTEWFFRLKKVPNRTSIQIPPTLFTALTQSGVPIYVTESTVSLSSSSLIWLTNLTIKSEQELELEVNSTFVLSEDALTFSLATFPDVLLTTTTFLPSENGLTSTWKLRVNGMNLVTIGKQITLQATLTSELRNKFLFKPGGDRISTAMRATQENGFGIDDAIVFPSPWIISRNSEVNFSKVPDNSRILILNASGEPVIELNSSGFTGVVSWDGKDFRGKKIASGIYFYQIIHDTQRSKLKKMAVLR